MLPIIVIAIILLLTVGLYWRTTRARNLRRLRIAQLRQWAVEHDALEPALQEWIQRLPTTEAQVLLDLLDGYCTSLNWELNWLFAPQIKKAPVLKVALEESVSAYARAILHSLQMEADVQAYQVYVAFEKKPTARKQRTLVAQLYQKVNEERLTPRTKRFFGRFSQKDASRKDQVSAIQQAFDRDPAQAMAALKEVLATDAEITAMQVRQELVPPVLTVSAGATA